MDNLLEPCATCNLSSAKQTTRVELLTPRVISWKQNKKMGLQHDIQNRGQINQQKSFIYDANTTSLSFIVGSLMSMLYSLNLIKLLI